MATFTVIPLSRWIPQDLDHRPRRTRTRNPVKALAAYQLVAALQLVRAAEDVIAGRAPVDALELVTLAARNALQAGGDAA